MIGQLRQMDRRIIVGPWDNKEGSQGEKESHMGSSQTKTRLRGIGPIINA